MKFINWWVNNFTIGGLFIGSVLIGIFSLLLIGSLIFGYDPYHKTKNGSVFGLSDFEKGIPLNLRLSNSIPDTSIHIVTQKGDISGDNPQEINEYLTKIDSTGRNERIKADSIVLRFIVHDWRNINDEKITTTPANNIRSLQFRNISVHIQPDNTREKIILLSPIIFLLLLMSFCSWQFAMFLQFIQTNSSFDPSNYKRLQYIGIALLSYNFILLIFDQLFLRFTVWITMASNNPEFRSPFSLTGTPDLHYGYLYFIAGCIFLILASAFKKGNHLQQEQDLTI